MELQTLIQISWRHIFHDQAGNGSRSHVADRGREACSDTPIAEIFPTFGSPKVLIDPGTSQTRPAKSAVTVRHLMTHTSGLVGSMVPRTSTFYLLCRSQGSTSHGCP